MSEWKEYKLGDVIEIKYGKDHKNLLEGIYPCFGSGGIMRYVNKPIYEEESILIPRKGSLNNIMHQHKPFWTVDTMFWSKINQSIVNGKFLFYQMTLIDYTNLNVGSAVPSLTVPVINDIDILLPPLPEQTAIASVLSSFDDKIDLLHRQNITLEKMAETLFRQWFIEEAKEEWEKTRLGSIVEVINGVSYKSDDLNSSKTAMVTLKSFDRNGGFRMDGFKEYIGKYKEQHVLKEGDLVVAHTDITQEADVIGNPTMVVGNPKYDTIVFSMDLVKVISKDKNYSNEFLYLLMKSNEFKEHCLGYSNGSTVLHLSKKAVPEYEIKLPPIQLINDFSLKVKPLIQKQFKNQSQLRTLTTLRDTLLPKLMSGEVKVEY